MASLSELAVSLEAAIKVVNDKKDSLEKIKQDISAAEAAYANAKGVLQDLHTEYSKYMANVMSSNGLSAIQTSFGQLHK